MNVTRYCIFNIKNGHKLAQENQSPTTVEYFHANDKVEAQASSKKVKNYIDAEGDIKVTRTTIETPSTLFHPRGGKCYQYQITYRTETGQIYYIIGRRSTCKVFMKQIGKGDKGKICKTKGHIIKYVEQDENLAKVYNYILENRPGNFTPEHLYKLVISLTERLIILGVEDRLILNVPIYDHNKTNSSIKFVGKLIEGETLKTGELSDEEFRQVGLLSLLLTKLRVSIDDKSDINPILKDAKPENFIKCEGENGHFKIVRIDTEEMLFTAFLYLDENMPIGGGNARELFGNNPSHKIGINDDFVVALKNRGLDYKAISTLQVLLGVAFTGRFNWNDPIYLLVPTSSRSSECKQIIDQLKKELCQHLPEVDMIFGLFPRTAYVEFLINGRFGFNPYLVAKFYNDYVRNITDEQLSERLRITSSSL